MATGDYIGKEFDIEAIYKDLHGYVSPPFPAFGNLNKQLSPTNPLGTVSAFAEEFKSNVLGIEMILPLTLSIPNLEWKLEVEPIISIRGSNKIVRRYPNRSEGRGSIKEKWSSDDYQVNIKGFCLEPIESIYPESQVKKLRQILEYKGNVQVENPLLRIFGIQNISINTFDIPHTPGLTIQQFTINAFSDLLFNSLLTEA
jgi:hypothetical protein